MRNEARFLKLLGALFLCLPGLAEEVRGDPKRFLRFVDAPPGRGRVETALCMYSRPDGVEVTLVAAVHFADLAYYNQLIRTFARVLGLVVLGALFLVFTSRRGK